MPKIRLDLPMGCPHTVHMVVKVEKRDYSSKYILKKIWADLPEDERDFWTVAGCPCLGFVGSVLEQLRVRGGNNSQELIGGPADPVLRSASCIQLLRTHSRRVTPRKYIPTPAAIRIASKMIFSHPTVRGSRAPYHVLTAVIDHLKRNMQVELTAGCSAHEVLAYLKVEVPKLIQVNVSIYGRGER